MVVHDEIRGERLALRPATLQDVAWLAKVAATPSAAPWWGEQGEQVWHRRLAEEDQDAHRYVIEEGGSTIGFAQWYEEKDPEYRHAVWTSSSPRTLRGAAVAPRWSVSWPGG